MHKGFIQGFFSAGFFSAGFFSAGFFSANLSWVFILSIFLRDS